MNGKKQWLEQNRKEKKKKQQNTNDEIRYMWDENMMKMRKQIGDIGPNELRRRREWPAQNVEMRKSLWKQQKMKNSLVSVRSVERGAETFAWRTTHKNERKRTESMRKTMCRKTKELFGMSIAINGDADSQEEIINWELNSA